MASKRLERCVSSMSGQSQDPPPPYTTSQKPASSTPSFLKHKPITIAIRCTQYEPLSPGPESAHNPIRAIAQKSYTVTFYPSTTFREFVEACDASAAACMGVDRAAMRTRAADAKPITLTPRNWEQFKELQGVREHCLGETPVFFRCFVTEKVLHEKVEGEGCKGEDVAEKVESIIKGCVVTRVLKKVLGRR